MTNTVTMTRDEFRAMLAEAEQAGATEDERAEALHAVIEYRARAAARAITRDNQMTAEECTAASCAAFDVYTVAGKKDAR